MKNYAYNKDDSMGKRMFQLLNAKYNQSVFNFNSTMEIFKLETVMADIECRVEHVHFIAPNDFIGIQRPQIFVNGYIEKAKGAFADSITVLDFKQDHQELPLTYVQTIDDQTMISLIEAGFYSDPNFEILLSKLMVGEMFSADSNLNLSILRTSSDEKILPTIFVEPVHAVHINDGVTHASTLQALIKHSAGLIMTLKQNGTNVDDIVYSGEDFIDREVFIDEKFDDVVEKSQDGLLESDDSRISVVSEISGEEIDVTDMLSDQLSFDYSGVDDQIRELKRNNSDVFDGSLDSDASNIDSVNVDDDDMLLDYDDDYSDLQGDGSYFDGENGSDDHILE